MHEDQVRVRVRGDQLVLAWIERLSDLVRPVSERTLMLSARYFCPQDYWDIVLERSMHGVCGYPICAKACTARTLVRDQSQKQYCSLACYKASMFFGAQLSQEPLALRTQLDRPPFESKYDKDIKLLDISTNSESISGVSGASGDSGAAADTAIDADMVTISLGPEVSSSDAPAEAVETESVRQGIEHLVLPRVIERPFL